MTSNTSPTQTNPSHNACALEWRDTPAEMLAYFKDALMAMPAADLVAGAQKMPELMQGLKQDKPNTDALRQRVLAKLQLKTPPPLVLDILRTATLSESLVMVLSEKAVTQGLSALIERFDRVPVLASMWLDDRDTLRVLAQSEMVNPTKTKTKAKTDDTFKQRFKPLLAVLRPVLDDCPYEPPTPRQAPPALVVQPLGRDELEREIKSSSLYRQLQRERNELHSDRESLIKQRDKLSKEVQALNALLKSKTAELAQALDDQNVRVAQGIADGLNKRIAPWLKASEGLLQPLLQPQNPLDSARKLLDRQAQEDKRYGTRAALRQEWLEAQNLLNALKEAQAESLRPLPQLLAEQRALLSHMEALQARLNTSSIEPTFAPLRQLNQTLLTIHEMDALLEVKRKFELNMTAQAWSLDMCQQAYDLLDRRAMHIYDVHHPSSGVAKDEHPPVTPKQHFEHGLRHARPCRLVIDGHNMLPKLKPLIGAEYFSPTQGPTARARALLVERVKQLTEMHPLVNADILFDGPDDQHWTETDRLRVWFSGGQGADRADGRILEQLQAQRYRGEPVACFVVTEDRDLLIQCKALQAKVVSPLEMWAMVY